MESVEVWMWLIAGILLASIIFVTAFSLIAKYTANMEVSQADDSFQILQTTINNVCQGGPENQEINSLVFPYRMQQLFVQDEHEIKGTGNELCLEISGLPVRCEQLARCSAQMNSIDLEREISVFYLMDKALGKKAPAKIRFTVSKITADTVQILWQQVVSE
ncbi:hypothetical protein KY320_03220 [Candidatus Woesearchaeota archaeon]|nr:hypothetical protein [Candidatus Woesearchaeota archaeon]